MTTLDPWRHTGMERRLGQQPTPRSLRVALGLSLLTALFGVSCGGGGGSSSSPPQEAVVIEGFVDDGTAASPIGGAPCLFVDQEGSKGAQTQSDANGEFRLNVPPERQGYVYCHPPGLPRLRLSTFISTVGQSGDPMTAGAGREEVSPRTTVVAELMVKEQPVDPQARKAQLFQDLDQDPQLRALADAATTLFNELFQAQRDVDYSDSVAAEEGGGSDGEAEGVEGSSDDGAEFSPIPNADCDFALALEGPTAVASVLADLFDNGRLDRPDLQGLTGDELCGAFCQQAFRTLFPRGIGQSIRTQGAPDGRYALAVPPGLPGFVRCRPPDFPDLVLARFMRARDIGERLVEQDVTPQATLFSHTVAEVLPTDLMRIQQNFLNDSMGLQVRIVGEGAGSVSGFVLEEPGNIVDADVGLASFSAVALFNVLYQNGLNADFPRALSGLIAEAAVTPEDLELAGVPIVQSDTLATVVNDSTVMAESELQTDLDTALSTAKIRVAVTDMENGSPLAGASVDILNLPPMVQCDTCPAATDNLGETILILRGVPRQSALDLTVVASAVGFASDSVMTMLAGIATVNMALALGPAQGGTLIVNNDEWTLSDTGFSRAPDAAQFARNVATFFAGGTGSFHAFSTNFGFTGASLRATLTNAGHTYSTGTDIPFELPILLGFDGIFVGGDLLDATQINTLIDYTNSGGNVYFAAGTFPNNPAAVAAAWNPFLNAFGLSIASTYNGIIGNVDVSGSTHPIFAGVSILYQDRGNSIMGNGVEVSLNGQGLYAVIVAK